MSGSHSDGTRVAGDGRLGLRLLGAPAVTRDGVPVRFDTRKALALLAYLAVTARPHGRDVLAGLLWPDADATRARAALRRTLSVTAAVGPALRTHPEVSLDLALVRCDVLQLREYAASSDPDAWRAGVELAADTFLAGFSLRDSPAFDSWQVGTSDAVQEELSLLLARLVAWSVAQGDLEQALAHARRRVQVDPMNEPAHADLVRVLAWTGDRPSALSHYRALVRLLDRELGVPPLPETVALHDDVRAGRLAPPKVTTHSPPAPPAEPAAAAPQVRDNHEPDLVGRDEDRRLLREAWAGSAAAPRAVGVVGDRGAGRTALVDDLSALQLGPVIRLAGHSSETDLPYVATADLLRALSVLDPQAVRTLSPVAHEALSAVVPSLGHQSRLSPVEGPGARWRLFDAARTLLEGAAGRTAHPLLVVVDDVHLVDRPSSELLAYLVRRLPAGVLVVATWPTGEGGSPLAATVAEQGAGTLLRLRPLDEAEVASVLSTTGSAADPAAVHRHTGGLPRLVAEHAVATGQDPVAGGPGGVSGLVEDRFDAAPATTQQVVGAAAVLASPADPVLLRLTSGRSEPEVVEAIEDAVARGLLVEVAERSGYDTPHELVRAVALRRTSLARTRLLHGRAADVLARRNPHDRVSAPAAAVARHLVAAGRADEAADWWWAAAQEALRLGALEEALGCLRQTQALGHEPVETLTALGDVHVRLGRYRDAVLAFEQAASQLGDGDGRGAADLEHRLAAVHERAGDWALAEAHLHAARDRLHDAGSHTEALDAAQAATVEADLALVLHRQGRSVEAVRAASTAVDLAERAGDDVAMARSRNVLGVVAARQGDARAAVVAFEQAALLAARAGDLDLQAAVGNNLARALAAEHRLQEAVEVAEQALALGVRRADRHRVASLHAHLADLFHELGDEAEAKRHQTDAAVAFADVDEAGQRPQIWTVVEW